MQLRLSAAAILASALAGFAAGAEPLRRGPEPEASVVLHLAKGAEAARVEAILPDPGQARPGRRPVSDLAVLLTVDSGSIDGALKVINGVPGSAWLFRARLVAVLGGRLLAHATARCGGWQNDVSTCRVACDGGVLALRRSAGATAAGADELRFSLVLGQAAAGELVEEARSGVLISACDPASGPEVRLVPAGAPSATLELARE